MDVFCAFFSSHMVVVYFFYGLGFFVTGLAVWLEASRRPALPLAQELTLLAAFGIIHGAHEWVEMFQLIAQGTSMLFSQSPRLFILAISFILLTEFGLQTLSRDGWRHWTTMRWPILAIFLVGEGIVWLTWGGTGDWLAAADAWCRYSLAVPGAVLAAAGFFKQSRRLAQRELEIAHDMFFTGLAFLLYGFPGQAFVGPSSLPPSNWVNSVWFMDTFHFPIQLLRTVTACTVAIFTVRALRLFEIERQRQMDELARCRAEAQQRLDQERVERERLHTELLRQTVLTQEEERQHIARELHDETGQAMTAMSWKLAAVEDALPPSTNDTHQQVRRRIEDLRLLTEQVMNNLRRLTKRLRPAVLDELGLVPALITYADDCSDRYPFAVHAQISGQRRRLPSDIETTLYRIAQEALTNVAKHAQASRATIALNFDAEGVTLTVADDGVGVNVENARQAAARGHGWGLAGIYERVQLAHGSLDIHAPPGQGTQLTVWVPSPFPCPYEDEAALENKA